MAVKAKRGFARLAARWRFAAASLVLGLAGGAHAQILIGQTTAVTGPVAASVGETLQGIHLYLDHVNAQGGVNGEQIKLITLDDKFVPKLAGENARKLLEDDKVVALFMTRATPNNQAILPYLAQYKAALIAPSTGAMVFHQPVNPYVFNVRSSYQAEAEKAIEHLHTTSQERIAVVHVDDSFGADGLEGARQGLQQGRLEPVAVAKFDRAKPDFAPLLPTLKAAAPQAVLVIGSGTAVVEGIRSLKAAGIGGQHLTLSNNASEGFVKLLGADAKGVVVSQVMPSSLNFGLVREATQLAKARGLDDVSPAMLEGFAAAKVLVEGLRRAAPRITRASLHQALDTLGRYDLGGLALEYTPARHSGLEYADLSIVAANGKFRR